MSEDHIPAWKRILSKKQDISINSSAITEDPLNVTTHLATGSLTRKEKKQIINKNGQNTKSKVNKIIKKARKDASKKRKDKLPKEERQLRRNRVLKDQLRYLIEFYRFKQDKKLPETLYTLESVKVNYPEDMNKDIDESKDVINIWKFSKQKQNWLLKNILNFDDVPIQYDDLLIAYFQDIQGRARTELLDKCRSVLEEWNNYATEQEEKIKALVEGNNEETDQEKKSDNESSEIEDENKDEEKEKEKEEEKDELETKEELPMPSKERVARCYKLVTGIVKKDENLDLASFVIKNFQLD